MNLKIVIITGLIFFKTLSFADILVEPNLGIFPFNTRVKTGGINYNMNGLGFGARLGFNSFGFMGGLNLRRAFAKIPNLSNDLKLYSHSGIFVGFNAESKIRGWGEFIFTTQAEFDSGVILKDGSGIGFGGGYYGIPFGAINLEFSSVRYAKSNSGAKASEKITMTLLSFSIPFVFPI